MSALRTDRHLAIALRKQSKSYSEINKELGIPESTMGYWFRGNPWSEEIKRKLIIKAQILARPNLKLAAAANKARWNRWHEECRNEATIEFPGLVMNPLFIAGLMLYWGEGDKVIKNSIVKLANSDPEMIKIFYLFLRKVLLIPSEKIIIRLLLYPDLQDKIYKKLWSKMINVPIKYFRKSTTIQGRHPERRLSYGVCYVEVYSRKLKEKIFTWINLYQEHFNKGYGA